VTSHDLTTPARALAIAAHPDDVEFQCGATLAKWAAAGCEVSHLICTDGSKGTWDVNADTAALVTVRQDEQRAAAKALGASGKVVFLGRVDGDLEDDLPTRSEVARWIRVLKPDVVLAHDPWKRYRLHPDHRAAGFVAVDGVVAARDPHFFPDHGIAHHRPRALLLFEADEPDHVEDVSGFAEAKIAALEAHQSQFETTMRISDEDTGKEREAFRRRVLEDLETTARWAAGTDLGSAVRTGQAERYKLIAPL